MVDYLKDSCPEQPYALCAYLDELPMPEYIFLWKDDAPISQAGGFDALNEEAREIVYGTLQAYPAEAAADALLVADGQQPEQQHIGPAPPSVPTNGTTNDILEPSHAARLLDSLAV